jgi:hypothetical protein
MWAVVSALCAELFSRKKKFTAEHADDCRDAGGRATQGAVAEIAEWGFNPQIYTCIASAPSAISVVDCFFRSRDSPQSTQRSQSRMEIQSSDL